MIDPETVLKGFLEKEDETAARVAEGIEHHRKADARIRLLGPDGAVADIAVS